MQHKPFAGQAVRASITNHPCDLFMVLPTDEKAFHPDHRATHKGVFKKASDRESHISPAAGNRKGNRIPDPDVKHGCHGGRDIYFPRCDSQRGIAIIGQTIHEKFIWILHRVISDQLPFTI